MKASLPLIYFVSAITCSPELVRDKLGVAVTSLPEQNEDGVIEYQLPVGQAGIISLTVKNASDNDVITIKDCTLLWSSSYFDYKDIARIDLQRGRLNPGIVYLLDSPLNLQTCIISC